MALLTNNIMPKTILYNFEINVLGSWQLKPLGLNEVKKPFIKFDFIIFSPF